MGKLGKLGKLEGTTVGSDNFFNFNQFPHLRNSNLLVINSVSVPEQSPRRGYA